MIVVMRRTIPIDKRVDSAFYGRYTGVLVDFSRMHATGVSRPHCTNIDTEHDLILHKFNALC